MVRCLFISLFLFLAGLSASAEYRAFELKIENTEKGKARTVISSLDNYQYPRFYPLEKNEVISYVDSWMCWENMSHYRKTCSKPGDRATASTATQAPAAPKPNSP